MTVDLQALGASWRLSRDRGRVRRWNALVGALSVFASTGELHAELDKNCSHGSKMATDENDVTVYALIT